MIFNLKKEIPISCSPIEMEKIGQSFFIKKFKIPKSQTIIKKLLILLNFIFCFAKAIKT